MKPMKYATLATLAVMLAFTATADTHTQTYGDYTSDNFDFLGVRETSLNIGAGFPMYGAPKTNGYYSVAGNTLDFDPQGFMATAADGASDVTDGNLLFSVVSHENYYIDQVGFAENGLFTFQGSGNPSDNAFVSVTAFFHLEVDEIEGVAVTGVEKSYALSFDPKSSFNLLEDGTFGSWFGDVLVDVNGLIDESGEEGRATKVSVDLNNVLQVTTQDGTTALIAKKDFQGLSVHIVPEPASVVLLIGASSMIALIRRRFIG